MRAAISLREGGANVNAKHQRFIAEYMKDLNATQAYIRAGYSPNGANASAAKLLANPSIRARVDIEIAKSAARTGTTPDRVLRELGRIAFAQPQAIIDFATAQVREDAEVDDLAAVASVKVKTIPTKAGEGVEREVKLYDKLNALDALGRHLGMFRDSYMLPVATPRIIDDIPRHAEKAGEA